jgi:tetratricopeptide (TPR) repeat protein
MLAADPSDSIWAPAVASLERRRSHLSVSEQLVLDAAIARRNGDLENYYRLIKRASFLAPDEPDALLTLAYAAVVTNRFAEAVRAVHRMSDHGGWVNDVGPRWWRDFEAHHMLGDFQGALRDWRLARRLNPDDFYICEKGAGQLGALGRSNEIIALASECDALPNTPKNQSYVLLNGGRELLLHGFDEDGHRVLSLALDRQLDIGRRNPGADNRANVYLDLGDWAHAYEAFRPRTRSSGPVRPVDTRFAVAAAHIGDTATANATLGRLTGPQADSTYKVKKAAILLALGRKDDALDALRSALPSIAPAYVIHTNTLFLTLRGNPRFEALLAPRR